MLGPALYVLLRPPLLSPASKCFPNFFVAVIFHRGTVENLLSADKSGGGGGEGRREGERRSFGRVCNGYTNNSIFQDHSRGDISMQNGEVSRFDYELASGTKRF